MSKKFLSLVMAVMGAMVLVFSNSFQTKAIVSEHDGIKLVESEGVKIPILSGVYTIVSVLDGGKAVDIEDASRKNFANVQLYERNGSNAQKFQLEMQGNGLYVIRCIVSGKVLDVSCAGQSAGTNVQQHDFNGTDAQKWFVFSTGDSGYFILSKCNDLYLDIEDAHTENGTNIRCWPWNGSPAQRFKFVR